MFSAFPVKVHVLGEEESAVPLVLVIVIVPDAAASLRV